MDIEVSKEGEERDNEKYRKRLIGLILSEIKVARDAESAVVAAGKPVDFYDRVARDRWSTQVSN